MPARWWKKWFSGTLRDGLANRRRRNRERRSGKRSPKKEEPVKKLLRALAGSMLSRKSSESWMAWSGAVLALINMNESVAGVLNGIAAAIGTTPEAIITGMLVYASGRIVKKVASA